MNSLIKELAEQAGYEQDMFGMGHWDMPECQKFAELIVEECINELSKWKNEPFPFDADLAIKVIKQHFGVEE
jgi:hypothetical protein